MSIIRLLRRLLGFSEISLGERRKYLAAIEEKNQEVFLSLQARAKYLKDFYHRYDHHLKSGLSEVPFLKEELEALNQFDRTLKDKKRQRDSVPEATVLNSIVEGIEARLNRYDQLKIHPKAHREIECLYGFLVFFEKKYHPLVLKAVTLLPRQALGTIKPNEINDHLYQYRPLSMSTSGKLPSSFATYAQNISTMKKDDDIQKEGQKILKEAYVLLKVTRKYCLTMKAQKEARDLKVKLPNGQTVNLDALLLAVIEEINEAFYAFRFKGLEGY